MARDRQPPPPRLTATLASVMRHRRCGLTEARALVAAWLRDGVVEEVGSGVYRFADPETRRGHLGQPK